MKKKENTLSTQGVSGFEGLLNVHTYALQKNSMEIEEMLKILSSKKVSKGYSKDVDFIKKELKRLNKEIDSLGDN